MEAEHEQLDTGVGRGIVVVGPDGSGTVVAGVDGDTTTSC